MEIKGVKPKPNFSPNLLPETIAISTNKHKRRTYQI